MSGTAKNDTFSATDSTLTDLDSLDGGVGTDALTVVAANAMTALPTGLSLTSVETLNLSGSNAIGTVASNAVTAVAAVKQVSKIVPTVVEAASTDVLTVTLDGASIQTTAGDGTATAAEISALIATAINTLAGKTIATVVGGYVNVVAPTAGTAFSVNVTAPANGAVGGAVPDYTFAITTPTANVAAVEAVDAVTAAALDVSALSFDTINVDAATTSNVKAAATSNVNVSGVTGAVTVNGGKDVLVTMDKNSGATTLDNAAGTLTVNSTENSGDAVATTDGTDVSVTMSGKVATGAITVGTSGNEQSGSATVTQTITGSDADILNAGNTITVNGGTSATVTTSNTITASKAAHEGGAITAAAVAVSNTSGDMTSITVTQNNTANDSAKTLTSAATNESTVVTFGKLKAGEEAYVSSGAAGVADLSFVAAKDLTAEEVAQAFANLASGATSGSASVANGYYQGTLDAGFTSGAADGANVTFTWTATGNQTDIKVETDATGTDTDSDNDAADDSAFKDSTTDGKAEVVAQAAANVATVSGAVTLNDNATASVTSVTLDGYGNTLMNGTDFDALETLTLKNTGNGTVAEADSAVITVTTQGAGGAAEVTTLDFTGMVVTTAGNLVLTINGNDVTTALALGDSGSEIAAKVKTAVHADANSTATVSGNVVTATAAANGAQTDAVVKNTTNVVLANEKLKNATVTVDTDSSTDKLTLNVDNVTGAVTIDNGTATVKDLTVNADNVKSAFGLTAAALTDLTVNASVALDLSATALGNNTINNVTVTGAGAVNLGNMVETGIDSFDASANTGGVTATINTDTVGDLKEYVFSAGADVVTTAEAAITKDVKLGGGDDKFVLAAGSTTVPTKTIDGGDGIDTISMNITSAAGLDANTNFADKLTGFERLLISNALNNSTIDVAKLGFANYVTTTGTTATASTLNGLANGATVVFAAANAVGLTLGVTDAATGTADSINLQGDVTTANVNFGAITANNIETVNFSANDTKLDNDADGKDDAVSSSTVAISADTAATVNVTGNAAIVLNTTGTKITLVDASATTGGIAYTADGKSTGQTVEGGSGKDTLTASGENDVLKGNDGNDTIKMGDLTQAYGGAGADTFQLGIPTNAGKISTIHDIGSGDILELESSGIGNDDVVKFYGTGAVYNANTVTTFEAKMNVAATQTGEKEATWFQHGGNTYVFIDDDDGDNIAAGAADTYVAGADTVVEIVGLVDLSTATFNDSNGLLVIA